LRFTLANDTDLNNATITVLISGSSKIIWDYNLEVIKSSIKNQKVTDFTKIMNTYMSSLSSYSFKLNPSWQRTFPSDVKRIKIEEVLN
jgi:hypothetical protein